MGICCSICKKTTVIQEFCIKLPNGVKYIKYSDTDKTFNEHDDINEWLKNLYKNSNYTSWIVYNDQIEKIGVQQTNKGHCKGIIAWNKDKISWLCHSTPNFPKYFDGCEISELEKGEHIYGQSYQYIEVHYSDNLLNSIIQQITIMEANIYIEKYDSFTDIHKNILSIRYNTNTNYNTKIDFNKIYISDKIIHIAKSSKNNIDIYSDYIAKEYNSIWYIETWIRGHKILDDNEERKTHHLIRDISNLKYNSYEYNEKQDHSKWGATKNLYWVGDLNRMTSQFKRGGGGFLIKNNNLSNALMNLIDK
jgi:deoxyribonuclease-2